MPNKEYIEAVAQKLLAAMELHESSWVPKNPDRPTSSSGAYSRTLESCFDEQFGDDPLKRVYFIAVSAGDEAGWNDIQSWCANVLRG